MFSRFKQWLSRWRSPEPTDLYRPSERAIYQYFNGQETIKIDPMLLYKRLMEIGPELDIDIKVANSPSKDASKAYESMLVKIRQVFELKPLAEGGLTETEAVELLEHFFLYNEAVKKKVKSSRTSSVNSVASKPCTDASPATTKPTVSGCAANGASTVKLKSSPTEPVSPSVASTPH